MSWHTKISGGYAKESQEAIDNANEIYAILSQRGWTKNAVAGLLGNVGTESGYNPWRWQGDNIQSTSESPWTNIGYGLFQFTPGGKYINDPNARAIEGYGPNFSDRAGSTFDGYAQTVYIDGYADYYATSRYPLSYDAFKASDASPDYLASAWLYNYERPADPGATEATRRQDALYWWDVLTGGEPTPPPGPGPSGTSGKWWIYMRRRGWWIR